MKEDLIQNFLNIRKQTEAICAYLEPEDYLIQGMTDVSPPKWHLAHTTWFYEAFILKNHLTGYEDFDASFNYLFNSYYQGIGQPFARERRGLLSRPLIKKIYEYRKYVDTCILKLLKNCSSSKINQVHKLLLLGLEHEQQHQELLCMDIKYNFSLNPDFPSFINKKTQAIKENTTVHFIDVCGGVNSIGYTGKDFCFDNELPCHEKLVHPFSIASKLVTNKEYLDFIQDGGYSNPTFWLSDGWDWVVTHKISSPLYWYSFDSEWWEFTLSGLKPHHPNEPVSHISFFEADAFARWCDCRLPSEEEWEYFVGYENLDPSRGNFLEQEILHPQAARQNNTQIAHQFFGDLWEWTSSSYLPYPGYKPLPGYLGEYNGKFMNNQRVLRGGSCVTPQKHIRKTYRNYFQPDKRWAFTGIRLVKDN